MTAQITSKSPSKSPSPTNRAAFFDVDGTLLKSTVVHHYAYLACENRPRWQQIQIKARLLSLVPFYLWLDRISRDAFNHLFYANYAGLAEEACRRSGQRYFQQLFPRLFPAALQQIAQHQSQGVRIVLVTGSTDWTIAPLAEWLNADSLNAQLQVQNGCYTGALQGEAVADQEKARLIRRYAETHQIDLSQSYAYGDSMADLPMLETVGYPVVVNPSRRLRKLAIQKGWPIMQWGSTRSANPLDRSTNSQTQTLALPEHSISTTSSYESY